nr:nucleoid-associated protein [Alteromonas profundi]
MANTGRFNISFVSKAGEPSGYFLDAFSCKANVTPAKATASAPKAARSFLLSVGVEKEKAKEAYYAVVDLLIESAEKPISISKIHRKVNEYLPENIYENTKDDFLAYAKNEEYQLPDTFQSKGTTARSLRQIKGEGEGWELNFDKDIIGLKGKDVDKSFMYDRDNDILYMPKIPSELKERIIQELGLGEGE